MVRDVALRVRVAILLMQRENGALLTQGRRAGLHMLEWAVTGANHA